MNHAPRHVDPSTTRSSRWSRRVAAFAAVAAALVASVAFATPASAAPTQVVVHRGDQLGQIAKRYCGTVGQYRNLAIGNHIANANLIYPGQVIKLTCNAAATGTSASRSPTTAKPIPASGWVNPLPGVNLTSCWGDGRGHKGIDMDGYMGQPVRAASAGVVSRTGQIGSGYGNEIMIAHSSVWTHYAHLSRIYVRPGQRVAAGQVIGAVGNSGQVVRGRTGDGSHLHFEVALKASVFGSQINPAPWLRAHGVSIGC